MFVLTTLWAVLLAVWVIYGEPLRREQVAIDRLREAGFTLETEPAGPAWLRQVVGEENLQHAISIEGWHRNIENPDCIADLSRLPRLCRLRLVNMPLTDHDLATHIRPLASLKELSLPASDITDASVPVLVEMASLEVLELDGSHVTVGGEERIIDARPDLNRNIGLAERLYEIAWRMHEEYSDEDHDVRAIHRILFCFQVAADWKLACAPLKEDPLTRVKALRQFVEWLQKLEADLEARHAEDGDVALVRCTVAAVRIRLVRANDDLNAEREACQEGRAQAEKLTRASWAALERAREAPDEDLRLFKAIVDTLLALETAAELEVADARRRADRDDERKVLEKYIADLQRILPGIDPTTPLCRDSGQLLERAMIRVWLVEARARKALATGDTTEVSRVIGQARADAQLLREFTDIVYEIGHGAAGHTAGKAWRFEKAAAAEIALARAIGDADGEAAAREEHRWRIGHFLLEETARAQLSVGGIAPHILPMLRCLYATKRLELEGKEFYEKPEVGVWPGGWKTKGSPEAERIHAAMERIRQSQENTEEQE